LRNPLAHGGPVGTVARVANGAINGAIIGTAYAGAVGAVVGIAIGALAGAVFDYRRRREEEGEAREIGEIADRLASGGGGDGGLPPGGTGLHRSHRDPNGGDYRAIRVRYISPEAFPAMDHRPAAATATATATATIDRAHSDLRRDVERSLLDLLVRMSYRSEYGLGPGGGMILQPEESFEELVRRFGIGTEGRGATLEVVDSYPVEVVARGGAGGGGSGGDGGGRPSDGGDGDAAVEEEEPEFGTCGICLENYRAGETRKRLSCPNHPHSFHADCIDKWLRVVASCPICKNPVERYKPPATT
jgi:hypothetical protein